MAGNRRRARNGGSRSAKKAKGQRAAQGKRGILGNLLGNAGGALGNMADSALGGLLGTSRTATNMAPVAFAGRSRASQLNTSRQRGLEQLATLVIPGGTPAGTILFQSLISPGTIGKRLKTISGLWARYKFHSIQLVVRSSNPATSSGNYTLAVDPDPTAEYISGTELPSRLMALTNASQANVWADATVMAPVRGDMLYTGLDQSGYSDAEIRQYADGQFLLATTTGFPASQTPQELTLSVAWDVTFQQPDSDSILQPGKSIVGPGLSTELKTAAASATVEWTLPRNAIFPLNSIPDGDYPLPGTLTAYKSSDGTAASTLENLVLKISGGGTPKLSAKTPSALTTAYLGGGLYVIDYSNVKVGYATISAGIRADKTSHDAWKTKAEQTAKDEALDVLVNKAVNEKLAKVKADKIISALKQPPVLTLNLEE